MSDLISRQAVNTLIDELARAISDERCFMSRGRSTGEIMSDILNLPSAETKGEWISAKVGKLFPSNDYKCSICGNILNFDGVNCGRGDANFCPNCGADMRGET